MNCQRCNTTIDYRFLTNCEHCETDQASLSATESIPELPAFEPVVETQISWTKRIINLAYLFVSSFAGMISGALCIFYGVAIFCAALLRSDGNSSHDCARGTAIGILALIAGGFLGTIAGSVFAVKNPLCKR